MKWATILKHGSSNLSLRGVVLGEPLLSLGLALGTPAATALLPGAEPAAMACTRGGGSLGGSTQRPAAIFFDASPGDGTSAGPDSSAGFPLLLSPFFSSLLLLTISLSGLVAAARKAKPEAAAGSWRSWPWGIYSVGARASAFTGWMDGDPRRLCWLGHVARIRPRCARARARRGGTRAVKGVGEKVRRSSRLVAMQGRARSRRARERAELCAQCCRAGSVGGKSDGEEEEQRQLLPGRARL